MHAVVAAGADGMPLRVSCGYCGSEHNYRGGPRVGEPSRSAEPAGASSSSRSAAGREREAFPLVSERERTADPVTAEQIAGVDFELLLRRIIREETGLTAATPSDKWRGG